MLWMWVGLLYLLSWWPWHALCLFSPFITVALRVPPHPPQLLHLFQLARVQGGEQRSITQAQSRRCIYSIPHSWQTGVTLCLLGGALSEVRVWGCHCYKGAAKSVCGMLRQFGPTVTGSQWQSEHQRHKNTHASTNAHLLISSTLTHSHWAWVNVSVCCCMKMCCNTQTWISSESVALELHSGVAVMPGTVHPDKSIWRIHSTFDVYSTCFYLSLQCILYKY